MTNIFLVIDWNILYMRDLFMSPIFLIFIFIWATYRKKKYNTIMGKYFVNALMLRILGSILTAFMYQFYYGAGDPYSYWLCIKFIWSKIFSSPETYINILFKPFSMYSYETMEVLDELDYFSFFRDPSTNIVIRFGLFFSLFTYNSFLPVSFFISIFSFLGSWRLFLVFNELYPKFQKEIALATLFIPSVFFWGTGVMKDPICIGALGFLTYAVYKIFIKRKPSIGSLFWMVLGSILLFKVKTYIIMSIAPALLIWVLSRYFSLIKSSLVKIVLFPIFITLLSFGVVFILKQFSATGQKYSLENLMTTAKSTQDWLTIVSNYGDGSSYNLGTIEYTPLGLVKVFPKAVNVTLYRPYLWEARKPILIPAAIESTFCFFLTIFVLYKVGIKKFFKTIINNSDVMFCTVFSLIFAFAVGFSTFNFGSLVRYKIPCLPFLYLILIIIYKTNYSPPIKKQNTH